MKVSSSSSSLAAPKSVKMYTELKQIQTTKLKETVRFPFLHLVPHV